MISVNIHENATVHLKSLTKQSKKMYMDLFGNMYKTETVKRARARSKGGTFWSRIIGTIALEQKSDSVLVGTTSIYASHKQTGGMIKAKFKKCLTIPISPESRNKNVGDFKDLFKIKSKTGNDILAQKDGDEIKPLFILRKSVKQKAEPFFPSNEETKPIAETAYNATMKTLFK